MTDTPTRADVCVLACADAWRGDGEIVASPIGVIPTLGARLAALTFEPELVYTDGDALQLAEPIPVGIDAPRHVEAWLPFGKMFDILWAGRRHVMMGATQVDRFGNQNIACIGPWARPKAQLLGVRGAPGNTVNHTTSYWVPNHSPRAFVTTVDCVSGVGYDRAAAAGPTVTEFHEIRRVVSNLGVFDFETPDHAMRLRSLHSGVTVDEVVAATGFELVVPDDVPSTPVPTAEDLRLLDEVLDPSGLRAGELPDLMHPTLHTELCDLCGIRVPIVQTGMGWVAGPRLTAATANAGGLGILASGTMDFDQLRTAITETRSRTDAPFGVNLRSDAPDAADRCDLLIREGVRVASFALAPDQALIARLKDGGVIVIPSIGARRHAEKVAAWGVDAVLVQGGEGGGHTGAVPTSLLLPQVVDTVDIPVIAAGGFFDGRGLVAALAYGAAGIAMGTRFLLTTDSPVGDTVKDLYLSKTVTDTLVTTQVDGVPHRVLRTDFTEKLDHAGPLTSLPRAVRNAWRFKRLSGLRWRDLLREGAAMRRSQDLSWSQVVMASNTPMLLKAAMVDGRPDLGVMSSGQVVGVIDDLPSVAELIDRIVHDAEAVLKRLGA